MREKIFNFLLSVKSFIRWVYSDSKEGKEDVIPEGYKKILVKFNPSHSYGNYKPDSPTKYWTDEFVRVIVKNKHFKLFTSFSPKKFNNVSIPYGTGVVESIKEFKYGYFTCRLKLPIDKKYVWPAFWLYNGNEVYSEIDIIEAYSKEGNYKNFSKFQSNVHFKDSSGAWINTGAKSHLIPENRVIVKGESNFIKFSLHWTKDFLRFYYDGYLVREITDKKLLEVLLPMKLVINNSVEDGKNSSDSTLEVKNIEVWQK